MASSASRILTSDVGSLVRPPQLVEFLHKIEDRQPYDRSAYEKCLKESIETIVRLQADAGIDIVSDGEFSKGRNWAFYIHDRLSGLVTRPLTPEEAKDPMAAVGGGQDRIAFPEFYAEYDRLSGLNKRLGSRFVVSGALTYSDAQIKRDIANLKAAVAKTDVAGAFLPVVAPASALPNAKNEYYPDEKSLLWALADCLHQEYKAVVDAGLYVQVDDAFLPYMHEKMVPPMTHTQYRGSAGWPISSGAGTSWAAPIAGLRQARSRNGSTPPACGQSSSRLRRAQRLQRSNSGAAARRRSDGRFERCIPVEDVDEDKVSAAFKHGALTVTMPKGPRAQSKVKRIPINGK